MKILYAIQGTGNGHLSRARDIIPLLQKKGEVDLLVSGCQADIDLPYAVKYRFHGLSFIFGKKGGIDYWETYKRNHLKQLFQEVKQLPVEKYDLIINDFEPVSAWACYIKGKPCVGLSHQVAVAHKKAPKPDTMDLVGKAVLQYYAPVSVRYGFHFLPYDKHIFTPVIREEVRQLTPAHKGYYTVYLPAYSDKKILAFLSCFPEVEWQVFSKHTKKAYTHHHVSVYPIQNEAFLKSMASAEGVLCGAGFETPAEVLYLQKKLMVIPMKGQYEQQCNAAALKALGVPVLNSLKYKQAAKIYQWLQQENTVALSFPNDTEKIIELILENHLEGNKATKPRTKTVNPTSFIEGVLKKVFSSLAIK